MKNKNIFRFIRKISVIFGTVLFYLLFVGSVLFGKTGFVTKNGVSFFFVEFFFVCVFLLFFHLAVIDFKKCNRFILEGIVLGNLFLQTLYIFLSPFGEEVYNSYKIVIFLTLVVFHIGIIFLISDKLMMFRTRRYFSSWILVMTGVVNFSLFIAISFSLLASGTRKTLPITCQELYGSIGNFAQRLSSPLLLGVEKASTWSNLINNASNITVGNLFGVDAKKSEVLTTYVQTHRQFLKKENSVKDLGILGQLEELKLFILEEVSDKSKINQGVCEIILAQVNTKVSTSKNVRYSIATLLFFLLYPLVRFFFFIVSFLSLIFLKILHRSKLYVWRKHMKEVEEIE